MNETAASRKHDPAHNLSPEAYEAFRRGLLKHVGLEEMILLPDVREAGHGEVLAF